MDITTKQAKRLKYLARCYSDSTYTTVMTDAGKVKHRNFPTLEISYNEQTLGNGAKVLSDILVSGNPFTGDFEELLTIIECGNPRVASIPDSRVDNATDDVREALTAPETMFELTCGDNPVETVENVIKENVPDGSIVDVGGKQEDGIVKISASVVMPNDPVPIDIEVIPDDEDKPTSISDPFGELTGATNPEFTPVAEESSVVQLVTSTDESIPAYEPAIDEKSIITEEKPEPAQVKKPTMAELIDLRMRCATIRLAEAYGESPSISIGDLMQKYPGAVTDFNDFLYGDGVKPYTISEASIQKAYPREYAIAIKKEGN